MRKRIFTILMAAMLAMALPLTAMAASSQSGGGGGSSGSSHHHSGGGGGGTNGTGYTGGGSSSSSAAASGSVIGETGSASSSVTTAAPGQLINEGAVSVSVVNADGTKANVTARSLSNSMISAISYLFASAGSDEQIFAAAMEALATESPLKVLLTENLRLLAQAKGTAVRGHDIGMLKPVTNRKDQFGYTIANLGLYRGNAAGKVFLLTSINTDGTIEKVPGVLTTRKAANGKEEVILVGAFIGTPKAVMVTEIY